MAWALFRRRRARASERASGGVEERGTAPAASPPSSTRPLPHSNGRAPGDDAPAHRPGATSAVPPEILRQVRLIELRTRGLVNSMFGGEYHSVFKGQGMEFAEVREYQAGDDIRSIDWNVTARMRHPYVKKHVEERELTVLLAVDLSGSEQFGTRGRFKAELATEIAAVLALSAIRNNDRVGLLVFSDHVEHFVPPKKGRRHVLRLIRDLLAFRPVGRGTDLVGALEYALKILPHRSIIFVLSDFLSPLPAATGEAEESDPLRRMLRMAGQRHDLVAVTISDVAEEALPAAGLLVLTDPETGEQVAVDTGKSETRALYRALVQRERERLRKLLRQLRVEEIDVRTDASYVAPLLAFFRRRERQLRR